MVALRFAVFAACLVLGACGWQLRGAGSNLDNFGTVYLAGGGLNDNIVVKNVRADLHNRGVNVSRSPVEADLVLWIGEQKSTQRTASYDVLVRAAENIMIMEVTYELRTAKGELLSGPNRVYAERLYEYDVQGVVSSAAQQQIILRELQDRLADQIVNRVASVDPNGPILPEPIDGETLYSP